MVQYLRVNSYHPTSFVIGTEPYRAATTQQKHTRMLHENPTTGAFSLHDPQLLSRWGSAHLTNNDAFPPAPPTCHHTCPVRLILSFALANFNPGSCAGPSTSCGGVGAYQTLVLLMEAKERFQLMCASRGRH